MAQKKVKWQEKKNFFVEISEWYHSKARALNIPKIQKIIFFHGFFPKKNDFKVSKMTVLWGPLEHHSCTFPIEILFFVFLIMLVISWPRVETHFWVFGP